MKYINLLWHKKNSYHLGKDAESKAKKYLTSKKYEILAHNFKTKLGEIDIIAKKDNYIYAFEIKYRDDKNILPYSISSRQQKRINQAFLIYLQKNQQYISMNFQFDVIFIDRDSHITHIENAWDFTE